MYRVAKFVADARKLILDIDRGVGSTTEPAHRLKGALESGFAVTWSQRFMDSCRNSGYMEGVPSCTGGNDVGPARLQRILREGKIIITVEREE